MKRIVTGAIWTGIAAIAASVGIQAQSVKPAAPDTITARSAMQSAEGMAQAAKEKADYIASAVKAAAEEAKQGKKPGEDPISAAAHATGEPSLQEILDKLGYSVNTLKDEIPAQRFRKAGPGPVTHQPIAAFGLIKVCTGGWYAAPRPLTAAAAAIEKPVKQNQWAVDEQYNKQRTPPLMKGARTDFDPGVATFGVWVSTVGFKDETVFTQNALQKFVPRFKPDDRHKAMVFPVKRNGKIVPNSFIIGWEYSTNNDFQDIVTILTNVNPIIADK